MNEHGVHSSVNSFYVHDFLYDENGIPLNSYILIASTNKEENAFHLPISLQNSKIHTKALLDSGAYSCFIHHKFARDNNIPTYRLKQHIKVFNTDSSENRQGTIKEYAQIPLKIRNHKHIQTLLVTNIGKQDILLGMNFLKQHNPTINWEKGYLDFDNYPRTCEIKHSPIEDEDFNEDETPQEDGLNHYGQIKNDSWGSKEQFTHFLNHSDNPQAVCLRGIQKDTTDRETWDKLVPKQYHDYGLVFLQKASERIPTRKPYDHAIKLLPDTQLPKPSKLYPLNPQERQSLNKWIDEELKKGYIRASKAPTAAPVFFVKKKDGKLRLRTTAN